MAGVQDRSLRPYAPCNFFVALLGASVVVLSVVGDEPSSAHAGFTLAGFLLWLLGVTRLLPCGRRPPFPRALAATTASLARRGAPCHFLMLIGASVVVVSVAGEPPGHGVYALAGFLLWLLGAARLLLFGQIGHQPLFAAELAAAAANVAMDEDPASAPA